MADLEPSQQQWLLSTLKKWFKLDSFRPLQLEAIANIYVHRRDTLLLMPTGGGKSLTFQLPVMASNGIAVVISPLIALILDQVAALRNLLGDAAVQTLHSLQSTKEQNAVFEQLTHAAKCAAPELKLIYITPERVTDRVFLRQYLQPLHRAHLLRYVAIDEAHCVSTWGHDFRPSYRRLDIIRQTFESLPIIAVTATATKEVRQDIVAKLQLRRPQILQQSFFRKNLVYSVRMKDVIRHQSDLRLHAAFSGASETDPNDLVFKDLINVIAKQPVRTQRTAACESYGGGGFVVQGTSKPARGVIDLTSEDKNSSLSKAIKVPSKRKRQNRNRTRDTTLSTTRAHPVGDRARPTPCGIIYCHKIATCEAVARRLTLCGFTAAAFHSKAKNRDDMLTSWLQNRIGIMVATIAFGMGIDKADVRFVIHWNVPKSIEGYYQQSGRAGRDGVLSQCILYFSREDIRLKTYLISKQQKKTAEATKNSRKRQIGALQAVSNFCQQRACRHASILKHFGERLNLPRDRIACGNRCDVCLHPDKVRKMCERFSTTPDTGFRVRKLGGTRRHATNSMGIFGDDNFADDDEGNPEKWSVAPEEQFRRSGSEPRKSGQQLVQDALLSKCGIDTAEAESDARDIAAEFDALRDIKVMLKGHKRRRVESETPKKPNVPKAAPKPTRAEVLLQRHQQRTDRRGGGAENVATKAKIKATSKMISFKERQKLLKKESQQHSQATEPSHQEKKSSHQDKKSSQSTTIAGRMRKGFFSFVKSIGNLVGNTTVGENAGRKSKNLTYKIIYVDDNPEVTDLPAGVTVVELPREGGGVASRAGKKIIAKSGVDLRQLSTRDIVIWDFDCTLSSQHLYKTIHMHSSRTWRRDWGTRLSAWWSNRGMESTGKKFESGDILEQVQRSASLWREFVIDFVFGGSKRVIELERMLKCGRSKHIVLSRGNATEICYALYACGLNGAFDCIVDTRAGSYWPKRGVSACATTGPITYGDSKALSLYFTPNDKLRKKYPRGFCKDRFISEQFACEWKLVLPHWQSLNAHKQPVASRSTKKRPNPSKADSTHSKRHKTTRASNSRKEQTPLPSGSKRHKTTRASSSSKEQTPLPSGKRHRTTRASSSSKEQTPLPSGWSKRYSNSKNRYFYYHKKTKQSVWKRPTD